MDILNSEKKFIKRFQKDGEETKFFRDLSEDFSENEIQEIWKQLRDKACSNDAPLSSTQKYSISKTELNEIRKEILRTIFLSRIEKCSGDYYF